jgi:hypothetical protein
VLAYCSSEVQGRKLRVEHAKRKRGHEKTPGQCELQRRWAALGLGD